MNIKKLTRCMTTAAAVLMLFAVALPTVAKAHTDPAGSTATGITISMTAYRNDGTTPVLGGPNPDECETLKYECTLSYAGGNNAAFEGGTWTLTTPDGVGHDITGTGIPCIGGTTDDPNTVANGGRGICEGSASSLTSAQITYQVDPSDVSGGSIGASCSLTGAFAHIGTGDLSGVSASTPFTLPVTFCSDGDFCNGLELCDPAATSNGRLGLCEPGVAPCVDELFCAEVTCNEETDQCDTTDTSTTVCPDNEFCADVVCNEETDQCDTTDTSTTVCPDNEFCADVRCNEDTDQCDTTDISATQCPDTTCQECDEDTDACVDQDPLPAECVNEEICRTPGFWGTHAGTNSPACAQNITQAAIDNCDGCLEVCGEVIDNTLVNWADSAVEAICVSPSGNIRLQLARQLTATALNCCVSGNGSTCNGSSIDEIFNACNSTCATSEQLSGPITALVGTDTVDCIKALDCYNNGGDFDTATGFCQTGTCANDDPCNSTTPCIDLSACTPLSDTCHDRELPFEDLGLATDCNAAGSAKECNDASYIGKNTNTKTANFCAVLPLPDGVDCGQKNPAGQGESCCGAGNRSTDPEQCVED